ncbi:MAG TPA: hypothetical protein VGZ47_21485 [Gemmataceae bacterium]|jgi:hypothetical protein|nr:hypothetical protein [Gemmataceae bacterium]
MATIDITCPNCGNASKGPDTIRGKKIRCKNCEHVFMVPAAATAAARKPDTAAEAKAKALHILEEEDEAAKNPYEVVEENLAPRCPHCALPMDPPDAVICVHCGYHMEKRKRKERKVTFERTFGDYVLWHLPTVGCFLGICALITLDVFCALVWFPDLVADSWLTEIMPPRRATACMTVWVVVVCLFFIWKMGKFMVVKRIMHFAPPEQEKKQKQDFMG